MGIRGAAVATVISQILSALYAIRFFVKNESILPLHLSSFKIRLKVLWETVILGFSFFVRQAGGSLMALAVVESSIILSSFPELFSVDFR